jgi:hypothetical protein
MLLVQLLLLLQQQPVFFWHAVCDFCVPGCHYYGGYDFCIITTAPATNATTNQAAQQCTSDLKVSRSCCCYRCKGARHIAV